MKWINSTAAVSKYSQDKKGETVFNYIDGGGYCFGGIIVTREKITWHAIAGNNGPADSVGQAKQAVEKLVRLALP